MSHTVYMFNMYNLIQEYYYQTALPPPLSLVERMYQAVMFLVSLYTGRCSLRDRVPEDSFSK